LVLLQIQIRNPELQNLSLRFTCEMGSVSLVFNSYCENFEDKMCGMLTKGGGALRKAKGKEQRVWLSGRVFAERAQGPGSHPQHKKR
jgi:hypothetical protein